MQCHLLKVSVKNNFVCHLANFESHFTLEITVTKLSKSWRQTKNLIKISEKYLRKSWFNYAPSIQSSTLVYLHIYFSRSWFTFCEELVLENTKDWMLPKSGGPDYKVCHEVLTSIFFMIKKRLFLFLQKDYIKKKWKCIYIFCNTYSFFIKIYFSNETSFLKFFLWK